MKRLLSIVLFCACVMFSRGEVIDGINYLLDRVDYTASVISGGTYIGSISIPSSVYYEGKKYAVDLICSSAFRDCTSLTSISIPNSVRIGDGLFSGCTSLTSISLPNSIKEIGSFMFCNCTSLNSVNIPTSVTKIGKYAFANSNLKSIEIPQSVTTFEERVFERCKNLQYVFIKNVSIIPEATFLLCTNLEFVEIPASVKYIASDAFNCCEKLKELRIPESCIIGDGGTLQNCDAKITRYSGSSNPQASTPQNNPQQEPQTIVVEHHRDPQPMQVWHQCTACYGSGTCKLCGGNGWNPYSYANGRYDRCLSCGGRGKCSYCAGQGGHYEVEYR